VRVAVEGSPPTDGTDWRVGGQDRYLAARNLRRVTWSAYRPGWDHDHCSFCWAKFGPDGIDGVDVSEGYVTADDDYHWICVRCFDDLRGQFDWTVIAP
jgi:hypothetical protein